ncbi:hypothetical protein GHT06_019056 [Daphnia sinensis]|uniref:Uncharacterized protein n=1 Tax=Daphnia sinensis TaxID=1820382 RepID=A0AAD5KKS8_9CRUS|nr:hypothetical protein GHT06_019056 [Daphnia sinensis]
MAPRIWEKTICVDGVKIFKYYFKLRTERGETQQTFSTEFSSKACDDSVVNSKYSHGNARKLEKTETTFYRTATSVLISAKERLK